jgi:glutathione reductase (NADPH)
MAHDFDLFVIGGGSGGVAAARRAAHHGARVGLCEDRGLGGTCVLRGCVPKKLLVFASQVRADLEDAAGFGWSIEGAQVDWKALVTAKDRELERLEMVYGQLLADSGVDVKRGRGRVVSPHAVEVGERRFTAARVLVATGGRPWVPGIPGSELAMTSDQALELAPVPAHVTVIGAGYIAVEFAGIFRGAGAAVTLLVRGQGILRGFDDDIRSELAKEMKARGVEIRDCEPIAAIERDGPRLRVCLSDGGSIATEAVLMATGRLPNTEGIGLADVGVELDVDGAIVVDEWSKTTVPSIFAIGDCTARPALTPMAIADGRAFAETEFGANPMSVLHDHVPTAVFSQPPVGTVGLTEAEARARGAVRIFRSRFRTMKHSFAGRESWMTMKLVVEAPTDRVLGVHIVGPDAPEIVQGFAVAVRMGATKQQFDSTLAIHPTAAEELVTMWKPVAE